MPDISSKKISKNFASLLAILFTDGSVSPKKKNSWRIYFLNSSEKLIQVFRDCIVDVFELDKERVRMSKSKNGFYVVVVNSKEIGSYLVSRFGTFRTLRYKNGELPEARLPVDQLIASNVVREFLKVAFSCDGGLCFYPAYREGARGGTRWLIRTVFLACHHTQLREDYMSLLQFLGIQARNVIADGKIKIEDEKNIRKFQEFIGFVDGVRVTKHSKFWREYKKQNLLDLMIISYENPSRIYNLSKFNRDKDIVRPLRRRRETDRNALSFPLIVESNKSEIPLYSTP